MTCLRCGYCCQNLLVVIVVDPDRGPVEGNLKAINCLEERCPHLRGSSPGRYSCAIHGKPWFKETPCAAHAQVERGNQNCRMGEHVLRKRGAK